MLAIYTRLSKEDEDSTSIENQLREGKEFAKVNEYTETIIYNEGEGISGTLPISKRPQFQLLLDDIIANKITTVWFRHQNRFERNSLTFFLFLDACQINQTRIFYADREFNYKDPTQLFTNSILSTMNVHNAKVQSDQTKKVLLSRVKQSKVHGVPAYGYCSDNEGNILVDIEESEVVKEIYKLSLSGYGYNRIAKHLNDKGIKTRYAKLGKGTYNHKDKFTGEITTFNKKDCTWKGTTVGGMIKNRLYKGERIWNNETYKVPPIVDVEYWEQVNTNLMRNRNNSGKIIKHKYLLRGLIKCARCGRNYAGRSRVSKKDHYYQCSSKRLNSCGNRSINIDRIEEYIWHETFVNGNLGDEISKAYEANKGCNRQQEFEYELSKLTNKKNSYKTKIDSALELIIEGSTTKELLIQKIKTYENSINEIDKEILEVKGNIEKVMNSKAIVNTYMSEFHQLTRFSTFEEKREIVNKFIKCITIAYEEDEYFLKIEFKIDIPPRGGYYLMGHGFFMPSSIHEEYIKEVEKVTSNRTTSEIV